MTRTNLFDESCILIEDGALMHRLARDKLDAVRQTIAGEGWGWIDILLDQPASDVLSPERLRPQQRPPSAEESETLVTLETEIAALDAQLEASEDDEALWAQRESLEARWDEIQQKLTQWVPEQMALAGVSLDIGHNGEVRITRGLIKRADLKALNKLRRERQDGLNPQGEELDDAESPEAIEHAPHLPQKLVEQLTSVRTCALRSEVAAHPKAALALLVHTLLLQRQTRFGLPGLDIRITPSAFEEVEAFKLRQSALAAEAPDSLEACFGAETDDLLRWLAILVAEALNVTHRHACAQDSALQESTDSIASLIDLDMKKYWAADEGFWLQAPKAIALEALGATPKIARMGVKDRDALLAQYAKKKKSELATITCDALQGLAWLPDILITPPREGSFEITPAGENALAVKAA
jgi:ParB family chromosome partitioning protein